MGYEIDSIDEITCLCGKGKIKRVIKSNDWGQIKENIIISCDSCNSQYEFIENHCCRKPKHEQTIYYLVDKNNKNKKKIDL